jgi:hypothetical protein
MSLAAWVAALAAVAVPNLLFAWRKRVAASEPADKEPVMSAQQRERWAKTAEWVWTIGTASFPTLWLLLDLPIEMAFFWSLVILGTGLNLLIVAAVVFAIAMSRADT